MNKVEQSIKNAQSDIFSERFLLNAMVPVKNIVLFEMFFEIFSALSELPILREQHFPC
ncbi:hypothetical protein V7152_11600 [Neobacillus drentensis]|uniref:hypothetical protein n=1 Tax=Neobacillus drentensis TaxID=220684 RepID=UPI002FFD92B8